MKIVAVFGDSANQRALAHRIHQIAPLAHIARIRLESKGRRKIARSVVSLTLARALRTAWTRLDRYFDALFADWPTVPSSIHASANSAALANLIETEKPDLILISGTDLVKRQTLERFAAKAMNLHTGISPYIKGAPNCTNWALAIGEFDLIGNTVMWIDPGIDTGAIIATERTLLSGNETLTELHIRVMNHAHDLYRRAVQAFVEGHALPAVAQDSIAEGRVYFNRQWDSYAMIRAVFNHRFRYRPFKPRAEIRLIGLD